MRTPTRALVAIPAAALVLLTSGCGSGTGDPVARGASRTIAVTMTDNAFAPTDLRVGRGETVTFTFTNTGSVEHEAILGDDAAQMAHHDDMSASTAPMHHGGMDGGSEGTDALTVAPGRTGELTYSFAEPGTLVIGCHEPGHWEAGMKATVTVG